MILEEGAKVRAARLARFGRAALLADLMGLFSELEDHIEGGGEEEGAACLVPSSSDSDLRNLLHTLLATGGGLLRAVEDDMLATQQRAWRY